jgi:hypothetical protein
VSARPIVVSLVLVALFAALVFGILRARSGPGAPRPTAAGGEVGARTSTAGGAARIGAGHAAETAETVPPSRTASAGPGEAKAGRLRVVGLGYELLAPIYAANGGAISTRPESRAAHAGAGVELVVGDRAAIERALARAGAADGAELAILPLPSFVEAYARLRALSPQIVLITASSRGREALEAGTRAALDPPAVGEVAVGLVQGEVEAELLALFALDLEGTPPSKVRFVARQDPAAAFRAVERGSAAPTSGRPRILLSTADATRLIPIVAVAPASVVVQKKAALAAFATAWFAGQDELRRDAPAIAQRMAAERGAPEPMALLELLGLVEPANAAENTALTRSSTPSTLETVFRRTWSLLRATGAISSPTPEALPFSDDALVAARGAEPPAPAVPPSVKPGEAGGLESPRVLLVRRLPGPPLDARTFDAELAFLAAVFDRSPIRAALPKLEPRKLEEMKGRLPAPWAGRVTLSPAPPGRPAATIEILAAP